MDAFASERVEETGRISDEDGTGYGEAIRPVREGAEAAEGGHQAGRTQARCEAGKALDEGSEEPARILTARQRAAIGHEAKVRQILSNRIQDGVAIPP